ncbi:hypothetical protein Misp01_34150 [Microtetraspora sp. NBRC 13810]|uniref:hypothetical protein n=1 Tax=Microtetraspora sp. NBRC 13810 TaxID=3030990 RepID=UPI0024A4872A|nr:hypothetical protein [Microtetraspora sp. NBRC 13810]GLW08285.1 hypothetical protein Misp01_34150 [Microtetraspora sp. NBRC 13810]
MTRRIAALLAVAAGASVLVTAAPAMADPGTDVSRTELSFDAGPEPAHKYRTLYLGGKLQSECEEDYIEGFASVHYADSCEDQVKRHRLGWKEIDLFFLPKGGHRWQYVDSVRTRGDGSFSAKVQARWSGTWKAEFDGARGLGPARATDYVAVVR